MQVANSGAGGANHVSAEAFALAVGIKIDSVPFDGAADARTTCIGGHVQTLVASPTEVKSASEAGQMQPLFVMEAARIADFPDVPTAVEKGVDFTWSSWKGIIALQKLPPETVAWLEKAEETVANAPDFKVEMGDFPAYKNAADFKARFRHRHLHRHRPGHGLRHRLVDLFQRSAPHLENPEKRWCSEKYAQRICQYLYTTKNTHLPR